MIEYIILLILIVEYSIFLPKIFEKAGEEKWRGYIPFYNLFYMIRIMKKPWWWIFFLIVPGVNFLMLIAMNLELARVFGRFSAGDTLMAIFLPWVMLPKLAMDNSITYVGPTDWTNTKHREIRRVSDMIVLAFVSVGIFNVVVALFQLLGSKDKPGHKTMVKEWGDALLFAIVAASIIRTFFLEAFKIPTPSMEKNLLVGDFLFVSKLSYGPKLPQTPIAFPFVHHTLPLVETKSYLEIFQLPYLRLPGFGSIQRNDVVVFNFPCGDSVILDRQNETYYQVITDQAWLNFNATEGSNYKTPLEKRNAFEAKKSYYKKMVRDMLIENDNLTRRPVDKEDHYIKRCVAIPGDVIEIRHRRLYVNGKRSGDTEKMEFNYAIKRQQGFDPAEEKENYKESYDISASDFRVFDDYVVFPTTEENAAEIKTKYKNNLIEMSDTAYGANHKFYYWHDDNNNRQGYPSRYYDVFPNDTSYNWTKDNFGPLKIPKEGETVKLDLKTLPLYRRIIHVYEKNKLEVKGNDIYINGVKTDKYTFKQNYYWLMGDNRQNSLDSRFWGFVPEDHVVGKGVLVWFSTDPEAGVRWSRIFTRIR